MTEQKGSYPVTSVIPRGRMFSSSPSVEADLSGRSLIVTSARPPAEQHSSNSVTDEADQTHLSNALPTTASPRRSRATSHLLLEPTAGQLARLAGMASRFVPSDNTPTPKVQPVHSIDRKISPAQKQEIIVRYQAGENTPQLSREYGISKSALLDLLHREAVSMRRQRITPEDSIKAAKLYEDGLSINEIVERIGYSYSTIRRALHIAGAKVRPKGIKRSSLNRER